MDAETLYGIGQGLTFIALAYGVVFLFRHFKPHAGVPNMRKLAFILACGALGIVTAEVAIYFHSSDRVVTDYLKEYYDNAEHK
jgi:hypothetical protein